MNKKNNHKRIIIGTAALGMIILSDFVPSYNICNDTKNSIITEETKHVLIKQNKCENIVEFEQNFQNEIRCKFINHMERLKECEDKLSWYKQYKNIKEEYEMYFDSSETIYDIFSAEEIEYMVRAVETECYDADFVSKTHVASVILNRINSELFTSDPIKIITTKNQFKYGRKEISEESILALEYAYEIEDTAKGSLFFHSNKKTKTFCGASYAFTDEVGHHFFLLEK